MKSRGGLRGGERGRKRESQHSKVCVDQLAVQPTAPSLLTDVQAIGLMHLQNRLTTFCQGSSKVKSFLGQKDMATSFHIYFGMN